MKRLIILYSLILTLLVGCTDSKVYKIGVSQCSDDDWRTKMNDEMLREIMFHEDASVEIRSADDNNEKQIADIQYFIDNGFDIIIASPNEAEALTPVIHEAYGKGIPVVLFDRNISDSTYTAFVGVDNVGLGRSAAHYALHALGREPKSIEIYGRVGSTPAAMRDSWRSSRGVGGCCLPLPQAAGTRKMPSAWPTRCCVSTRTWT